MLAKPIFQHVIGGMDSNELTTSRWVDKVKGVSASAFKRLLQTHFSFELCLDKNAVST